jgi:hypothetical protein
MQQAALIDALKPSMDNFETVTFAGRADHREFISLPAACCLLSTLYVGNRSY